MQGLWVQSLGGKLHMPSAMAKKKRRKSIINTSLKWHIRPDGRHASLPCPSPSTGVCSNSYPLSWWCHPTISSSVTPFSSCLQFFRVFSNESALCNSGQSTGISALASVLVMNIQGWLPLGLTGLISLLSKRLSRVFSSTAVWKHKLFGDHS